MPRRLSLSLVAVAAASLLACSSSSSSSAPTTSAPTIKDFTLAPATLTVGTTVEVSGTMTIEDADGDIAGASGDVLFPPHP